jgi:hypothetical protein
VCEKVAQSLPRLQTQSEDEVMQLQSKLSDCAHAMLAFTNSNDTASGKNCLCMPFILFHIRVGVYVRMCVCLFVCFFLIFGVLL